MLIENKELELEINIPEEKLIRFLERLGDEDKPIKLSFTISSGKEEKEQNKAIRKKLLQNELSRIQIVKSKKDVQKERNKDWDSVSSDEKIIFDAWNDNPFIVSLMENRTFEEQRRNYPIDREEFLVEDNRKLIRKVIGKEGVDSILESISEYFRCCSQGDHIWEGKNHGFKNLVGFLKKIHFISQSKGEAWWRGRFDEPIEPQEPYDDPNEETTLKLIEALGYKTVENPSETYQKFMRASAKIVGIVRKGQPFDEKKLIGYLLDSLEDDKWSDHDRIFPGHLCSERTWDIVLPDWIRKNIGGHIEL